MTQPHNRNIATCIVFSILTCGIYSLYWLYCIADDIYRSGAPEAPRSTPGMVILLDIVTCGIYGFYMYYKWGKAVRQMYNIRGWHGEDRSTLYLVLYIFGLSIVSMAMIQDDFNKIGQLPPPPMNPYDANGNPVGGNGGYNQPYQANTYPNQSSYAPPQNGYTGQTAPVQPQTGTASPQSPFNPQENVLNPDGGFSAPPGSPYNQ